MALLTQALNTNFTSTKTSFVVEVRGGDVDLFRRQDASSQWHFVGVITDRQAVIVDNPVVACQYRLVTETGSPTVRVDD